MIIPIDFLLDTWDVFLLVFIRITGLFVIAPIFSRRSIPLYHKIGFSFMLTILIINTIPNPELGTYQHILQFVFLLAKEFVVGIAIGYVAYLIFNGIYLAGQLIDMRIGFGMVNVLDPLSNIQIPITANFYFIICMIMFLGIDGHFILINAIAKSYNFLPIGAATFNEALINDILSLFTNIFFIGFKIAAPVTAAILVTDVALGVISKAVPQINVFVLGMPLKIGVGLLIMVSTLTVFKELAFLMMDGMDGEMYNFIIDMAGK